MDNPAIQPIKLSTKDFSTYTGFSRVTIERKYPEWAVKYGLRFHREGKKLFFNRKTIDRMIEAKEAETMGELAGGRV